MLTTILFERYVTKFQNNALVIHIDREAVVSVVLVTTASF